MPILLTEGVSTLGNFDFFDFLASDSVPSLASPTVSPCLFYIPQKIKHEKPWHTSICGHSESKHGRALRICQLLSVPLIGPELRLLE